MRTPYAAVSCLPLNALIAQTHPVVIDSLQHLARMERHQNKGGLGQSKKPSWSLGVFGDSAIFSQIPHFSGVLSCVSGVG